MDALTELVSKGFVADTATAPRKLAQAATGGTAPVVVPKVPPAAKTKIKNNLATLEGSVGKSARARGRAISKSLAGPAVIGSTQCADGARTSRS